VHIVSDKKYWSYLVAREHLKKRLQASVEEINMWAYLGQDDGGIDAFNKPNDNQSKPPHKRHFTDCPRKACFLREQIESFNPNDNRRFLTLQQLTDRWVVRDIPKELVQDYVDDGDLEPINVLRGCSEQWEEHTKVLQEGETVFIPDSSLFALDQVLEIEAREFPSVKSDPERTGSNPDGASNSNTTFGTTKRWTPEVVEELVAYHAVHGTKKAAEKYGVHESRIRAVIQNNKPQPTANNPFGHKKQSSKTNRVKR